MRVLVVDAYDSFTYNLCQQIGSFGAEPVVVKNDSPLDAALEEGDVERIILSPGPGRPEDSGLCLDLLGSLCRTIPTLGVCLGHQAICIAFGADVIRAKRLMHGKTSEIAHDGAGIFTDLDNPFTATRYHSLIADDATIPGELVVSARSSDDGYVMGVRHRDYPIEGIQFHPESILCREGNRLIGNFLAGYVGRRSA
jgi:anthranilate synthase/aminodeoxychorismate synthase-like glutamine amidotransferase